MDSNDNMLKRNCISKTEILHEGKWITSKLVHFIDTKGKPRKWEVVGRTTNLGSDVSDAVVIIPVLRRKLHHDCLVMVKQFRVPVGCFTLEFPAGLIDASDKDIQSAALRELYEETGYKGKVTRPVDGLLTPLDPGILETTLTSVCVEIDGDEEDNINPKQHLDESECVDVVLFPTKDFSVSKLQEWVNSSNEKTMVDSRLYSFALGMQMSASLLNPKPSPGE